MDIDEVRRLIASTADLFLRELGPGDGHEQTPGFRRITVVVANRQVTDAWGE